MYFLLITNSHIFFQLFFRAVISIHMFADKYRFQGSVSKDDPGGKEAKNDCSDNLNYRGRKISIQSQVEQLRLQKNLHILFVFDTSNAPIVSTCSCWTGGSQAPGRGLNDNFRTRWESEPIEGERPLSGDKDSKDVTLCDKDILAIRLWDSANNVFQNFEIIVTQHREALAPGGNAG